MRGGKMTRHLTVKNMRRLSHKQQVQVAIYAAELVVDLVEAEHKHLAELAIKTTKRWLKGEASAEECGEVSDEISADCESHAVRTFDWLADAASRENSEVARTAISYAIIASPNTKETKDKIYTYYDNLLNVDKYVEEAFLGE